MRHEDTSTNSQEAHQSLGRYVLKRPLARGGMAEVYLATAGGAHGFEKLVAIKKILPKYGDNKQFVHMMVDEAKITVLLNHPNVAQIIEFSEDKGEHFIVMEYVPGETLGKLAKRARKEGSTIGELESAFIVSEMLAGLHAAHTQTDGAGLPANIIHRDVSPQNVLLSFDGHIKLIDFGIAKARDRMEETRAGTIKGKLRYLAPEMVDPDRFLNGGEPDHRIDVFAAGIVLYELLVGHNLFSGKSDFDVYEAILNQDIEPPAAFGVEVALSDIVMRALKRKANERFQNASEFSRALRSWVFSRNPNMSSDDIAILVDRYFADEKAERQRLDRLALDRSGPAARPNLTHDTAIHLHTDARRSFTGPTAKTHVSRPSLKTPANTKVLSNASLELDSSGHRTREQNARVEFTRIFDGETRTETAKGFLPDATQTEPVREPTRTVRQSRPRLFAWATAVALFVLSVLFLSPYCDGQHTQKTAGHVASSWVELTLEANAKDASARRLDTDEEFRLPAKIKVNRETSHLQFEVSAPGHVAKVVSTQLEQEWITLHAVLEPLPTLLSFHVSERVKSADPDATFFVDNRALSAPYRSTAHEPHTIRVESTRFKAHTIQWVPGMSAEIDFEPLLTASSTAQTSQKTQDTSKQQLQNKHGSAVASSKKRRARKRKTATAPVLLMLRADVPATVYIDGQKQKTMSPLDIKLKPGRHTVVFERADYAARIQKVVRLVPGQDKTVRVQLTER